MKYRDKKLPTRDVYFHDFKLVGNDKIKMKFSYETESKGTQTYIIQPVTIDVCQMRNMGRQLHVLLDELEDRLHEARETMKGTR